MTSYHPESLGDKHCNTGDPDSGSDAQSPKAKPTVDYTQQFHLPHLLTVLKLYSTSVVTIYI